MKFFLCLAAIALVAGCSQQQLAAASNGVSAACHVATAAEAADPAFTSHNGKIVNGIAIACASAPAAEAIVAQASTAAATGIVVTAP